MIYNSRRFEADKSESQFLVCAQEGLVKMINSIEKTFFLLSRILYKLSNYKQPKRL